MFRFCEKLKSEFIWLGKKKLENKWRRDWCWMRTDELQDFHEEPLGPLKGSKDWTFRDPKDKELAPICTKIKTLREAGFIDPDVACHFIGRRVAPLQRRSHLAWMYTRPDDGTRLQRKDLSP